MLKTAIVHEWFVNYAGSERCVESFTNIWREADVFALVDFLNDEERDIILGGRKANTSFIQKLPFAKKRHRNYLPLFPRAVEKFNLKNYDIIISSSHSVAKGVLRKHKQLHISYCHSPMRYVWDSSEQYMRGIKGKAAKLFINFLRNWDMNSAANVDFFIANSNYIAGKIERIYRRKADVIYPPVDIDKFDLGNNRENFYLTASRLVPYKQIGLVVKAFNEMPDKNLKVIGSGPEKKKIRRLANKNIEIIDHQPPKKLKEYLQKARAFVFAAEEDFGIIVVEAMACGTPVIALNKGGTAESVIDGKTGILYEVQTPEALKEAIAAFDNSADSFNPGYIRKHSEQFSRKNFEERIKQYVTEKSKHYFEKDIKP